MSTSNNNNNKRRALPSPSNSYKRHKKFILPPRAKNLPVVQKLNALLGDKKVEVETPPLPPPIATAVEQPKECKCSFSSTHGHLNTHRTLISLRMFTMCRSIICTLSKALKTFVRRCKKERTRI
jgi:hypothetical protein